METITPPCAVLLSRVHLPIIFYQHRIYCVYLFEGDRFVSAQAPGVLDQNGELLALQAEIPVGTIIRVHAIDGYLRTVQVVERKVMNPFAPVPVTQLAG
jgi:hypothetical protein